MYERFEDEEEIKIPADAIAFIESRGTNLFKFEVVEYFFEWLKTVDGTRRAKLLGELLADE